MTAPSIVRTWSRYAATIPMTNGSTYWFFAAYVMEMPQRNPGETILVSGQAEVTNPYPFNVMCTRYIGYSVPNPQAPMPDNSAANTQLSPARAENVTPDMHHMTVDCVAVIDDQLLTHLGLPLTLAANWWLTLTLCAASTAATAGEALVNEGPGYGELVAVIFPAT